MKDYHNASILPKTFHPILPRLISRGNLPTLLQEKKAKWHQSFKSQVTNSKSQRFTQKRKAKAKAKAPIEVKRPRIKKIKFGINKCFIPGCKVETTDVS